MSDRYESVIFICPKIDVFVVPPPTGRGFRTDSWGPLAKPIFTGRLRIMQSFGDSTGPSTCDIRIEDSSSGELFAAAPYIGEHVVERALDSSRYYQLRVVHEKRVAYLGIGFEEREPSFDFQVALSDFTKQVTAEQVTAKKKQEPVKDYAMKEGQSMNINLSGKVKNDVLAPARVNSPAVIPFLAPPPSAAEVRQSMNTAEVPEDDFGEFQ